MCRKAKDGTIKRCKAHAKSAIEAKRNRYTKGLLNAAAGIVPFIDGIALAYDCQTVSNRLRLDTLLADINALDRQLHPLRKTWAKEIQRPWSKSYEDPIFNETLENVIPTQIFQLADAFYLAAYYDDIKDVIANTDSLTGQVAQKIAEKGWADYHILFNSFDLGQEEPVFGAIFRRGYESRFPGMIENIRIRRIASARNSHMQELMEARKEYDVETSKLKQAAYDPKKLAVFDENVYRQQSKNRELLEEIRALEAEYHLRYDSKAIF